MESLTFRPILLGYNIALLCGIWQTRICSSVCQHVHIVLDNKKKTECTYGYYTESIVLCSEAKGSIFHQHSDYHRHHHVIQS